ncbi:SRPBCC family protein [Pontibacillus yanchengensis]|uniref:ATPase n=1 Tax=Pontibacillus yanchengensis Y32 TaxID=1385514 RepID=A0A0A2TG79_9BACI|nr:SRPBCC family protein [Pontibacillus yanchengensis]KGP73433.1 ATPase [Pontibacillus yanchengensis Y32]
MNNQQSFVYTTYILTTPEKLWEALTSGEHTSKYFFGREIQSNWKEGSNVQFITKEGELDVEGKVLQVENNELLSYTWHHVDDKQREVPLVVTFKLRQMNEVVKLTLVHENLDYDDFSNEENTFGGLNNGWPAILSNLKTLLETGKTLSPMDI